MSPAVFSLVGGIAILLYWLTAQRFRNVQRFFTQVYSQEAFPFWFRTAICVAPLYAVGSATLGIAALIPSDAGRILALPALDAMAVAFALSYRSTPPMPGWLRRDILGGLVIQARPDFLDWLLFWIVVPLAVAANVVWPALLVAAR